MSSTTARESGDAPTRSGGSARLRVSFARLSESLESRLWPIPVAAIGVAVIVGILMPLLDSVIDPELPPGINSVVFNGGAETARTVLSAIAGSLITATSLTFSLTVVALQLASTQASPRVLRLFARDGRVHGTLAVFLGTFSYSLTVLRSIRDGDDDSAEFVPRVAVTVAMVLTITSVIVLVFFLAHLARQLRVETMLKDIHAETVKTISLLGDTYASDEAWEGEPVVPEEAKSVGASSSGFFTRIDRHALVAVARRHRVVIQMLAVVGESTTEGIPIARYWNDYGVVLAEGEDARIVAEIQDAHSIGYERTAAQDIGFGIQQIADIGVKALSPGVNDPTTAVNALGHLAAILAKVVAMPQMSAALAGDDRLRLVTRSVSRADFIAAALSQIRRYGAGDLDTARRFVQLLADLATLSDDRSVHEAIRRQLSDLEGQLTHADYSPHERRELHERIEAISARLSSRL